MRKSQEKEIYIDFHKMGTDIIKRKKMYYIGMPIALILALVYSLSLIKTYSCEILLSPEPEDLKSFSISSLAKNFNMNLGDILGNQTEALFPIVYPDLFESTDFLVSLFPIKVKQDFDGSEEMPYYDYLLRAQKSPWWSKAKSFLINGISELIPFKKKEDIKGSTPLKNTKSKAIDVFNLSKQQNSVAMQISRKVKCKVDFNSMLVTITVKDQDPLVAATVADSINKRLQHYISNYRINKVRMEYSNYKSLTRDLKQKYDSVRNVYSEYIDSNREPRSKKVISKMEMLGAEMELYYNAYSETYLKLIEAEERIQKVKPVFFTLKSATVPTQSESPNIVKNCILFIFLSFCFITIFVWYKEGDLNQFVGI